MSGHRRSVLADVTSQRLQVMLVALKGQARAVEHGGARHRFAFLDLAGLTALGDVNRAESRAASSGTESLNGCCAQIPAVRRRLRERVKIDPERAFESVLMNGRKARESGLWRKAWAAPAVAVVPAAVPAERKLLIRWRSCSVRTARDHTQSFLKPRRDEVEEGPKLQRLLRLCDKYDLHWVRRWRPIGQYRDQCPATGAGRCLIGH